MLIVFVAEEASDRGIGPEILIQLIPYFLPKALMFAMPATCLFSVCVVFGRLAAKNEITAIQSLGLNKSVIIAPALALAFLLSLFAVWINDISFAWSYWGIEQVVLESSDEIAYGMLRSDGTIKTDKFSIEVDAVEDRTLIQPIITISNSNNERTRAVAQEAVLTSKPEAHSLEFTMKRGSVSHNGKSELDLVFDSEFTYLIELKSPAEIAELTGKPGHLYLSQIGSEIEKQIDELEQLERRHAIHACSQMITGDMVGLTNSDWNTRIEELEGAQERLHRLHVVPHRRWANGFSCFAFAMIGIPVALRLRTSNYATTFGICFLPILVVYYPLFMFGLNGAKMGTLPPYAAWMGDLVCVAIGGWLMYREFRR